MPNLGPDAPIVQLVLPALTGGLFGALFTLLTQTITKWWNKPSLRIEFDSSESGCDVLTDTTTDSIRQHYLRAKIENRGRTIAKGVAVSIESFVHTISTGDAIRFGQEVLDLKWSLSGEIKKDIPSKGYRYIDLFHATGHGGLTDEASVGFAFVTNPVRIAKLGWGVGEYRARLFVSAENAASVSKPVNWDWDGSLGGLKILSN